jgi:trehalose 6-phosphate phosphatase
MNPSEAVLYLLDAGPLALTTDFDGTVSEIAPTPETARLHPRCRDSLAELSEQLPLVAVVSGRHVEDVRQLVGLPRVVYVGNHGLERWENGTTYVEPSASEQFLRIRSILGAARHQLNIPGLIFEEKGTGASIHYRSTANPSAARRRITSLLRDLAKGKEVKVVEGRRVVELRPASDTDKGTALIELLCRYDVGGAIYAGDDRTDLDAFAGIRRWAGQEGRRAVTVGVISAEMPPELGEQADVTVDGVEGWADLLDALAEAMHAGSAR